MDLKNLSILVLFLQIAFLNAQDLDHVDGETESHPEEYYEIEEELSTPPPTSRNETDAMEKFFSTPTDIVLEHVDFVTLRLRHIVNQTSTKIEELRALQKEEFLVNPIYAEGWDEAKAFYKQFVKKELRKHYPKHSPVHKVPDEYHIALIAYTLQSPEPTALYSDFNAQTRELCSGKDILAFNYKSFFRFVELATEHLGGILKPITPRGQTSKSPRFLYRGVSRSFALEEGQLLAFQHFISTSVDLKIAERFSGSTLFEFDGEFGTTFGVYLGNHSPYDEEEVLLSPLQIFQVDSIHKGGNYTRYVLKSRPLKDPDQCEYFGTSSRKSEASLQTLTTTVAILGALLGAVLAILIIGLIVILIMYRKSMIGKPGNSKTVSELQLS